MAKPTLDPNVWITRTGDAVEIKQMASSHLLSTIHFIEKNRFLNALETFEEGMMDATEYYLRWPPQYEVMIAEAQRRNLIFRNTPGLVKSKRR
jgi:hypothetical protein